MTLLKHTTSSGTDDSLIQLDTCDVEADCSVHSLNNDSLLHGMETMSISLPFPQTIGGEKLDISARESFASLTADQFASLTTGTFPSLEVTRSGSAQDSGMISASHDNFDERTMTDTNDRDTDDRKCLEQGGTTGGMVLWEEFCQEYPDQDGDTVLHLAVLQAVKHLTDIVQLLRLQGQINFRNRLFQTPLHLAALTSQYAAVQPLLDLDASLSAQDCHGNTPLHTACERNDYDMLRALLGMQIRSVGDGGDLTDRNDDVRLRDGNGHRSAVDKERIAQPRERNEGHLLTEESYGRQLKTRNDRRESGGAGVFGGDRTYHEHPRTERLVGDADNGNGDDCSGWREDRLTPLCMLPKAAGTTGLTETGGVGEGWREGRRREEEVAVVLAMRNYEGLTCLHIAVQNGSLDMVELLLEKGADVNARDGKSGRSPLHFAIENNQPSTHRVLLLLLQHPRLLINEATFSHQTALQLARGRQRFDLVDLLHEHGADWSDDVCDWSSDSPSDEDMEDDAHMPYDDLCVAGQPLAYTGWR